MAINIARRKFISVLGGATVAWPLAARAQQPALPVVAFINAGSADGSVDRATAFSKGLNKTGYFEGKNVTVEYHWLDGHYDGLSALVADLVRRQVAAIATPASALAARAANAATATIPIVFGAGEDPVQLGLLASLARPGGNVTGINFLTTEVTAKELRSCMTLCPRPFVSLCSSIRPILRPPSPHCGTYGKPPRLSGYKSRSSTPRRSPRSMRPLPVLRANAPTHSSSVLTALRQPTRANYHFDGDQQDSSDVLGS